MKALFIVLMFVPLAASAETVHLFAKFLPVRCSQQGNRIECDAPEKPGPDLAIELSEFHDGRSVDVWVGESKRRMIVGGEDVEVTIKVRKRLSEVFKATSFEVVAKSVFVGKPETETSLSLETSHYSVASTLKDLNTVKFSGTRKVDANQFYYPLVVLGPPREAKTF